MLSRHNHCVTNLKTSNRLSEQQRDSPKIGMARRLSEATRLVLLWSPLAVLHVPEVVFAPLFIRVLVHEVILVRQL